VAQALSLGQLSLWALFDSAPTCSLVSQRQRVSIGPVG